MQKGSITFLLNARHIDLVKTAIFMRAISLLSKVEVR